MDYAKESLRLHEQWKGKIEVVATVPMKTKEDLSLGYTPGPAIAHAIYRATGKWFRELPITPEQIAMALSQE